MTLGERIKKIRKDKDLTQQEFCEKIGLKRNSISLVESGKRNISDQAIKSICREFNVSETWLRTGEGEMFDLREKGVIDRLCTELHASELDAEIIRAYFRIDPKIRESFMRQLIQEVQSKSIALAVKAETTTPAPDAIISEHAEPNLAADSTLPNVKTAREMTDVELHAELDRQLSEQKQAEENPSACGRGKSDTVAG